MADEGVLLVDNGSLVPAATRRLRDLAAQLAARVGRPVEPVSLLHASGIPAGELDGVPAEILEPALARRLAAGRHAFVIVPLFFGPSGALTDYLPARVAHLRRDFPALRVRLAPVLYQAGDRRLAEILADQARALVPAGPAPHRVALVDHGSPVRAVAAVRDALAADVGARLGASFLVAPCSMERREGPEYSFSDPLLANLLRSPGWDAGDVIVALQFLLPGRHAGPGGDVATICRAAEEASEGRLRTRLGSLVADDPRLAAILADRLADRAASVEL